jgi:peroxiredoxin
MRPKVLLTAVLVVASIVGSACDAGHEKTAFWRLTLGSPPPRMPRFPDLVGHPVPKFSAVDQNGSKVDINALRGRVVVINIWATWCGPCRKELPRIEQEVWRKHQGDVVVVAVGREETATTIAAFNRHAGLTFSLVPDPKRTITALFGHDVGIPRIYVVNRNGIIVQQHLGYGPEIFQKTVEMIDGEAAKTSHSG